MTVEQGALRDVDVLLEEIAVSLTEGKYELTAGLISEAEGRGDEVQQQMLDSFQIQLEMLAEQDGVSDSSGSSLFSGDEELLLFDSDDSAPQAPAVSAEKDIETDDGDIDELFAESPADASGKSQDAGAESGQSSRKSIKDLLTDAEQDRKSREGRFFVLGSGPDSSAANDQPVKKPVSIIEPDITKPAVEPSIESALDDLEPEEVPALEPALDALAPEDMPAVESEPASPADGEIKDEPPALEIDLDAPALMPEPEKPAAEPKKAVKDDLPPAVKAGQGAEPDNKSGITPDNKTGPDGGDELEQALLSIEEFSLNLDEIVPAPEPPRIARVNKAPKKVQAKAGPQKTKKAIKDDTDDTKKPQTRASIHAGLARVRRELKLEKKQWQRESDAMLGKSLEQALLLIRKEEYDLARTTLEIVQKSGNRLQQQQAEIFLTHIDALSGSGMDDKIAGITRSRTKPAPKPKASENRSLPPGVKESPAASAYDSNLITHHSWHDDSADDGDKIGQHERVDDLLLPSDALESLDLSGSGFYQPLEQDKSVNIRQGFYVGDLRLMIDFADGSELTQMPNYVRVPNAAGWLVGLTNLHGAVIPIFDLVRYFGLGAADKQKKPMLLVLQHGSNAAGIIISGLPRQIDWDDSQQAEINTAPEPVRPYIRAACMIDGKLWFDLDTESLCERLKTGS